MLANYKRPPIGALAKWFLIALLTVASGVYGYYFAALAPLLMMPFFIPLALFTALLIWALPTGDYAPTKSLYGLFWFFCIALVLWPNYLAIALPGLPWVTLLRIASGPLAAALLICVSVSEKFRKDLAACLNDAPYIWKTLIFYVAIVTVSLVLSHKIPDTLSKYAIFLINQVAVFFVSCYVLTKPRRVEFWVYSVLFMDLILCGIGLWEARLGYVPWVGHIPSFLRIEDPNVTRILSGAARAATGLHRVQAVATTSLGLAEILGLTAPFALHLALGRYPIYIRMPAVFSLPLFVYVIILTDARLGFVAMLVSASLYLLLRSIVRWREVRGSIFGPAIVLTYPAIFCALVASTFLIGRLRARVWGDGSQAASTEARKGQWASAIPKIISHPIGHGYGEAGRTLGWTNAAGISTIDSYFLNLLLDTGFIGFLAYLAIFGSAGVTGALTVIKSPGTRENRLLMPLVVIMPAFVIVKGVLSQDANHPLIFIMLGAITALVHRTRQQARDAEAGLQSSPAVAEARRR